MAAKTNPAKTPPVRMPPVRMPPSRGGHNPLDFAFERDVLGGAWGGDPLDTTPPMAVIGVDEAGRGPWAGPVVAGAAWINPDAVCDLPEGLDDSKKLTPHRRTALMAALNDLAASKTATKGRGAKGRALCFATASVSAAEIDRLGILPATFAAMDRAAGRLAIDSDTIAVLVDGTLAPPFPRLGLNRGHGRALTVMPIVKGDGRVLSIAVAALAAKCARDAEMQRLDAAYPGYGWASNMGYGVAAHAEALTRQGPTPHHRLTFRPVGRVAAAWGYTR